LVSLCDATANACHAGSESAVIFQVVESSLAGLLSSLLLSSCLCLPLDPLYFFLLESFLFDSLGLVLLSMSLFELLHRESLVFGDVLKLVPLLLLLPLLLLSLLPLLLQFEFLEQVARSLLGLVTEFSLVPLEHLDRLLVLVIVRNRKHRLSLLIA
jgi:hypothetical protein